MFFSPPSTRLWLSLCRVLERDGQEGPALDDVLTSWESLWAWFPVASDDSPSRGQDKGPKRAAPGTPTISEFQEGPSAHPLLPVNPEEMWSLPPHRGVLPGPLPPPPQHFHTTSHPCLSLLVFK